MRRHCALALFGSQGACRVGVGGWVGVWEEAWCGSVEACMFSSPGM